MFYYRLYYFFKFQKNSKTDTPPPTVRLQPACNVIDLISPYIGKSRRLSTAGHISSNNSSSIKPQPLRVAQIFDSQPLPLGPIHLRFASRRHQHRPISKQKHLARDLPINISISINVAATDAAVGWSVVGGMLTSFFGDLGPKQLQKQQQHNLGDPIA